MNRRHFAHAPPGLGIPAPKQIFLLLTEASQRALAAVRQHVTPDKVDLRQAASDLHDPAFVMLRACQDRLLDVVAELLNLGLDPTIVGSDTGYLKRSTIPLAWVVRPMPSDDHQRAVGEQIADLLLARGADPNHVGSHTRLQGDISAMHAACVTPWLLRKLIAQGGNVRLVTSEGWSVLDHWRWTMNSATKDQISTGLEALTILLDHGVSHTLMNGQHFLTSCWASGTLRRHIPAFIEQGLDPHERGTPTGKSAAGPSLMEHLGKKIKAGKGGELAVLLLAHHQAQALDQALPQAQAGPRPPSPRL